MTRSATRRPSLGRWTQRRITHAALGVLCAACVPGCQSQPTKSYGIKPFEATGFRGHTDFILRQRERSLTTGTSKTRSKETIFEESVSLETDGYLLHPNLFEFGLGAVFGLLQEEFEDVVDRRRRDTKDSGDLFEFEADAHIFKKRSTPLSVFANRRRRLVPRPFLPSLETTTTSYGATWQYVSKETPMTLQFTHTDAKLSPLLVGGDPNQPGRQKHTELRFELDHHFSAGHDLSLRYKHESVSEQPFALDYDADEITLVHQLAFGGDRKHRLRSELNYLDQRGTIDIERLRWREDLRLEHTDTLRSRFQLEVLDRTRGSRTRGVAAIEEQSAYVSGSLRHQLFESQTSQILLFARKQKFKPDLDITRWGGQTTINYHKTNPWGILYADYIFRYERNDHDGPSRTNEIIDETHTFRDPQPLTLGNRNVIVGSITVTATDGVTVYHRGWDYSVQTIGDSVEIWRLPGGRIPDGTTVVVDYLFTFGGTFKLDTLNHNFDVRQEFSFGLTPYYRFEWQDQKLSPATATGALAEDITGHLVGLEFQKASLRIFAEYEDRDSTINPFSGWRVGTTYTHRFDSGTVTTFNARWSDIRHHPPHERDITLLTLEARLRQPITTELTIEGAVLYRNGEDSVARDTEGVDASMSLEWSFRDTKIMMSYEYSDYKDDFTQNDSSALFFHLNRKL